MERKRIGVRITGTTIPAVVAAVLLISMAFSQPSSQGPGTVADRLDTSRLTKQRLPRRLSLVFAGDLMQHMPQVNAARTASGYDYDYCFRHIKPLFDSTDLTIINLETTIDDRGNYSGYPMFASPPEVVTTMQNLGCDVALLANNHIADKGRRGIKSTTDRLSAHGILYTGAFPDTTALRDFHPLYIKKKGFRLAILNYTYGTNGMPVPGGTAVNLIDTAAMAADLRAIDRGLADVIIACIHWGEEYQRRPSQQQKELDSWLREQGVDVIIGSHPHVVQPITAQVDTLGGIGSLTVYSLGNFVSNQRNRYTDGGIAVRVELSRTDETQPPKIEAGWLPFWVNLSSAGVLRPYEIVPCWMGDSLLAGDAASLASCRRFLNDTRTLLSGSAPVFEMGRPAASLISAELP